MDSATGAIADVPCEPVMTDQWLLATCFLRQWSEANEKGPLELAGP
jgi:hypothetical protein